MDDDDDDAARERLEQVRLKQVVNETRNVGERKRTDEEHVLLEQENKQKMLEATRYSEECKEEARLKQVVSAMRKAEEQKRANKERVRLEQEENARKNAMRKAEKARKNAMRSKAADKERKRKERQKQAYMKYVKEYGEGKFKTEVYLYPRNPFTTGSSQLLPFEGRGDKLVPNGKFVAATVISNPGKMKVYGMKLCIPYGVVIDLGDGNLDVVEEGQLRIRQPCTIDNMHYEKITGDIGGDSGKAGRFNVVKWISNGETIVVAKERVQDVIRLDQRGRNVFDRDHDTILEKKVADLRQRGDRRSLDRDLQTLFAITSLPEHSKVPIISRIMGAFTAADSSCVLKGSTGVLRSIPEKPIVPHDGTLLDALIEHTTARRGHGNYTEEDVREKRGPWQPKSDDVIDRLLTTHIFMALTGREESSLWPDNANHCGTNSNEVMKIANEHRNNSPTKHDMLSWVSFMARANDFEDLKEKKRKKKEMTRKHNKRRNRPCLYNHCKLNAQRGKKFCSAHRTCEHPHCSIGYHSAKYM